MKETERAICLVNTMRMCVCVHVSVKVHRMCITTSDSSVAGLNISSRYELTVKFSCSGSSRVRDSAIV